MSFGKGSTTVTPNLTPEQKQMLQEQTKFFTETIRPTYETAVRGATDVYNQNVGGVNYAGQNLAGVAGKAQETLGGTGEAALRTGVGGLMNLFTPEYEAQQMQAALAPAQAQYLQNVQNQGAQFGGAGQMGSARQALAARQLAGSTQSAQQAAAAEVQKNIAAQRMAAAQGLIGAGQGGLTGAQQAAGNIITASMLPQNLYNQYASVIFGTPQQSYNPSFAGTQGQTTSGMQFGIGGAYGSNNRIFG